MGTIHVNSRLIFRVCAALFAIVFAITQPGIFFYLFLAFILTLIGKPLVEAMCRFRMGKWRMPRSISAMITVIIFVIVMVLSLLFFVPSLIKEVQMLRNIDYNSLFNWLQMLLDNIQDFFQENKMLEDGETVVGTITTSLLEMVNMNSISKAVTNAVTSTSSFFLGLFAVFFITFFFLKDDIRMENIVSVFFPENRMEKVYQVMTKINNLLSRYFIGLVIKTFIMTVMLYVIFLVLGVRNPLLLALIGGITNIIPYLGPLIGGIVCFLFAAINSISLGMYDAILWDFVKIVIAFAGGNLVDNLVLGPWIYSQSIRAHPVEVFLVTLIGGQVGGIGGMVLGIPVYTIIRVVVIEIYNSVEKKDISHIAGEGKE